MAEHAEPINFKVAVHLCFETYHLDFCKNEVEHVLNELNKDFAGNSSHFVKESPYVVARHKQMFLKYVELSADSRIRFTLVKILHAPIPAQTSVNIKTLNRRVKDPSVAVSPSDTLNIWVVDMPIHGYATYPWQLKDESKYDGVVISKSVFGRLAVNQFSLGKVLTHMVGHWLGVLHTFEKDSLIEDVPDQDYPTYGNPLHISKQWPGDAKLHMYMNFMDLTDDSSSFMFTTNQIQKMHAAVYLYRRDLAVFPQSEKQTIIHTPKHKPPHIIQNTMEFHFENGDNSVWNLIPRMNEKDAKIERKKSNAGITLKRNAAAEVPLNMSDATSATLSFVIKDSNANTTVLFGTNDKLWQRTRIMNKTDDWEQFTIPMPGPFGPNYTLRFQAPSNNKYIVIDHIVVKKM